MTGCKNGDGWHECLHTFKEWRCGWVGRFLTGGGRLGPEQVWIIWVGLQVRMGGVFLQKGNLTLPDGRRRARGGMVWGGRGGRMGRREQGRGRGWRHWATWRMEGEKGEWWKLDEPMVMTDSDVVGMYRVADIQTLVQSHIFRSIIEKCAWLCGKKKRTILEVQIKTKVQQKLTICVNKCKTISLAGCQAKDTLNSWDWSLFVLAKWMHDKSTRAVWAI